MKKFIHIISLLLLLVLGSCEEKSDFTFNPLDNDLIVVEGVISNEKISHRVKLSRTYTNPNETPLPLSVDTIFITDGTDFYSLTETPIGSGEYFTRPFRAVFGKGYLLVFFHQGVRYLAIDSPPPGEPLDQMKTEEVSDNMYRLDIKDSGVNSSYTSHQINWESTTFCKPNTSCFGEVVYYDLKTIDVHEIYKPEKEDFIFPKGSQIIRKKYSLSQNHEAFLRSVLSETEWRGGIFDIEQANAITNLSEGAIGYFGVSTVVIDTTIVE